VEERQAQWLHFLGTSVAMTPLALAKLLTAKALVQF
jgi:hypothetical protein